MKRYLERVGPVVVPALGCVELGIGVEPCKPAELLKVRVQNHLGNGEVGLAKPALGDPANLVDLVWVHRTRAPNDERTAGPGWYEQSKLKTPAQFSLYKQQA